MENPAYVDETDSVTVTHTNQETPVDSINVIHASKSLPNNLNDEQKLAYEITSDKINGQNLSYNENGYGSKIILVDNDALNKNAVADLDPTKTSKIDNDDDEIHTGRDTWGKDIEFLLSCIAMSVGLGNLWRFPFIALENGGGAFVIPYVIVLIIIGKPLYYLEMLIGQFSSRGSVKVYDLAPALRGAGIAQVVALIGIATFYSGLMAIILHYLWDSFKNPLPWSYCREEWENCINANSTELPKNVDNETRSSTEFYFVRHVLREKDSIDDGIGSPNGELVICLAVSWTLVALLLIRGVKSSGKASYFLAIFPYVVLMILFIRAITLPGAMKGIKYFFYPQWDKLLDADVWYNAVTQVFFSLSVCFGNVIMYASYNKFRHNVSRDATIVTTIDTFTSLLAGSTVFGILGHLAYKVGTDDMRDVVKGGPGLAFISYPDAISKFDWMPQLFSVLFFFMLYVLGIGSNIAMTSCLVTIFKDYFKTVKQWQITLTIAVFMFCIAIIYTTPGGQFVLELVDRHGVTFIALAFAIVELVAFSWVYGVKRLCDDVFFMLGYRPNIIWQICWKFITPGFMTIVFIYTIATWTPVTYGDYEYQDFVYVIGWCITALGLSQLPIWILVAYFRQQPDKFLVRLRKAFQPHPNWGPRNPILLRKYQEYIQKAK